MRNGDLSKAQVGREQVWVKTKGVGISFFESLGKKGSRWRPGGVRKLRKSYLITFFNSCVGPLVRVRWFEEGA